MIGSNVKSDEVYAKGTESQWPDLGWLRDGRARSADLLNQSIAKSGEL